ncbi:MAG: response regulator transcription factor [Nitrospiria bacterium]
MGMENFCCQIPEIKETLSRSQGLLETFQKANNITLLARKFVLSPREGEVLMYLSQGINAKEIASMLRLSTTTVRTHIQRILKKLQVHSMLEAVALALGKNHS